ncbi:MAG: aldehyde dehydrogenase family protein, partial [Steroidobacteraceae bacterium]
MRDYRKFYIGGAWVEPAHKQTLDIVNPATEEVVGRTALAAADDVDRAMQAARAAFTDFSVSDRAQRRDLLRRIIAEYERRYADMADAITQEMGAPIRFSREAQTAIALDHLKIATEAFERFAFEETRGSTLLRREPIGVCVFITPWNWPANQISSKVAPALVAGCTMVLKPSEIAPFSAQVWTEIMDAAGTPPGVFNMIFGDGPVTGAALSAHPEADMVSFTGSTLA